MPEEKNGYARWWQVVAAMIVAALAIVGFLLAQENKFVHKEEYRIDQTRMERQLDRIEAKLDTMQDVKH